MTMVRLKREDGTEMAVFLAEPEAAPPHAAVIVIHEAFGLNRDIRAKARRLASMGYVAAAPDLFAERGPMPICMVRAMTQLRKGEGPAFDDLELVRARLAEREDVDASRIGVIGFCMGGGFALLLAARATYGSAAVFYGAVPNDIGQLEGACPVIAGFGGRDRIFGKNGRKLERMLTELEVPHDVKTYAGAGHSYMSDHHGLLAKLNSWGPMKLGFSPDAAEDSWRRLEAFFGEHLGQRQQEAG